MSIAIRTQSVRAPVFPVAPIVPVRRDAEAAAPDVRGDAGSSRAAHGGQGRHALLDALTTALEAVAAPAETSEPTGVGEPDAAGEASATATPASAQASRHALHAYTHELLQQLRPVAGEGGHGRGFAWGHTSPAQLAQRLDALVQRLQGSAPAAGGTAPGVAPPPVLDPRDLPTLDTAPGPVPGPDPLPAALDAADPATLATAGAAISTSSAAPATTAALADAPTDTPTDAPDPAAQAVASRLQSAYADLTAARSPAVAGSAGTTSSLNGLVALLRTMADALRAGTGGNVAATGGLIDVTA